MYSLLYRGDSLSLLSHILTPWGDYHYAVIEDTFLYTANFGNGDLVCINIADPESMFVYRTCPHQVGTCGIVVIDGYAYIGSAGMAHLGFPEIERPYFIMAGVDVINSPDSAYLDTSYVFYNRKPGYTDGNDSLVFWVNTEMADDTADFEIGYSHIGVWERDYSYTFSDFNGEMAFNITVLNDDWIAVGFESGFSILSIEDLDSIHEVAFYQNCDSIMRITHFALKENRLYAMGHPRDDYARLYLFELDTTEMLLALDVKHENLPREFKFLNYPNPFNSSCRLCFTDSSGLINQTTMVEIFDLKGRLVDKLSIGATRRVAQGLPPANPYEVIWTPDASLGSGVYLVRAIVGDKDITKRVVYLK